MEKRKAAKEIFKDYQNAIEDETEEFDEFEEYGDIPASEPEPGLNIMQEEQMVMPPQVQSRAVFPGAPSKPTYKKQDKKPMPKNKPLASLDIKSSEELQLEKDPVQVKINGFWIWKRVIIPPNAYVVHTRLNKKEPITLGLGVSFKYNPFKDAFIVIPAAMQTIGVVANCISKEKQGINVLAYVQWQIDDFSIAYKKLDLANVRDPLGIVNAQLREQAEAAIKDKIATMSVEEVLTDKAPIIEELTSRLSRVAEGQEGLGIKIITVQIREAIVSSATLWNDLQSPFRNEQRQKARISHLDAENEINKKELETRKLQETREAETNFEIEKTREEKYTETLNIQFTQESKRFEEEQKNIQNKSKLEEETLKNKKEVEDRILAHSRELKLKQDIEELKVKDKRKEEEDKIKLEAEKRILAQKSEEEIFRLEQENIQKAKEQEFTLHEIEREKSITEKESELEIIKQEFDNSIKFIRLEAERKQKELELLMKEKENLLNIKYEEAMMGIQKLQQEVNNILNENRLTLELINNLPEIAANMPKVKELKVFQTDKGEPVVDSIGVFVQKMMSVL
ncbi:MAG: hypothetical protein KDK36_20290, partial [Leptospiraceae bacterium]|nr:hypothetical protein [Leptospiraceae bacterium]